MSSTIDHGYLFSMYMFWILSKTMSKQLDNANRPTEPGPCVGMHL